MKNCNDTWSVITAINAAGEPVEASVHINSEWSVRLVDAAARDHSLSLACVFPWGDDVIYIFGSVDSTGEPIELLPSPVAELLLFAPAVPFRWTSSGFQALTASEWLTLAVTPISERPTASALHTPNGARAQDDESLLFFDDRNTDSDVLEDDNCVVEEEAPDDCFDCLDDDDAFSDD